MEIGHYWLAVRARVCSTCIDGDGWGNCRLDRGIECPLPAVLPRFVELVMRSSTGSLGEYEPDLRAIVCSHCAYRNANGTCRQSRENDCALDRRFAEILEAVEGVDRRRRTHAAEPWDFDLEVG